LGDSWINCQSCGHRYGSWLSACPQCGSKNAGFKKGLGKGKKIAIGAGIAVVAFFAFVILVDAFLPSSQSGSVSTQATNQESSGSSSAVQGLEKTPISQDKGTEFVPTVIKRTIINEKFTVSAGAYKVYTLSAPKDATNVSVNGNFTAKDGIAVSMMDGYNFESWKQGRAMSFAGDIYYTTGGGMAPNGTIQTPLYGTYIAIKGEPIYLIFNNKLGNVPKSVEAIIELSYTEYKAES
jgi:hypothetical protein